MTPTWQCSLAPYFDYPALVATSGSSAADAYDMLHGFLLLDHMGLTTESDIKPGSRTGPEGDLSNPPSILQALDKAELNAKLRDRLNILQWPKPAKGVEVTVYSVWIMNWQDNAPLRADSIIGPADAAMKLLYYSRLCDDGLRYDETDQTDTLGFHLVPFEFNGYPTWEVQDPTLPLTAVFTDARYFAHIGGNKIETTPNTPNAKKTATRGVLRASSYQQNAAPANSTSTPMSHPIQPQPNTPKSFQELLAEGPSTGLASNDENTFYITAVFEPEDGVHPVTTVVDSHPVLTSVENIPTAARGILVYAHCTSTWQLQMVRKGQKDKDGEPKKQGSTYVVLRLRSKFGATLILSYITPDMDMNNIRIMLKGVQLPDTETRMAIVGLTPDACPEGLKYLAGEVQRVELLAKARNQEISKADAADPDLHDVFFRKNGLRTTRLNSPEDRKKVGADGAYRGLKDCMHIETDIKRTEIHREIFKSASTSGTLREIISSKACLIELPKNTYNISQAKSYQYMSRVRAHMAYNHHHSSVLLNGISETVRRVRVEWQANRRKDSPWQHKTISINGLLRSIITNSGLPVFSSVIPYMMGPNIGSALATSRNLPEITDLRDKIAVDVVTWMYWYSREVLGLTESCILLLLKSCDPDTVLLLPETEWHPETWSISTPFEDAEDEFVRTMEEDGIVLDMSAMEEQVSEKDEDYARRLKLSDDATFATKNSAAISRVTNATINTSGADSFRSSNTADARRDFKANCIRRAREAANNATRPASQNNQQTDSANQAELQGQPACKGSAATTSDKTDTSRAPSVKRSLRISTSPHTSSCHPSQLFKFTLQFIFIITLSLSTHSPASRGQRLPVSLQVAHPAAHKVTHPYPYPPTSNLLPSQPPITPSNDTHPLTPETVPSPSPSNVTCVLSAPAASASRTCLVKSTKAPELTKARARGDVTAATPAAPTSNPISASVATITIGSAAEGLSGPPAAEDHGNTGGAKQRGPAPEHTPLPPTLTLLLIVIALATAFAAQSLLVRHCPPQITRSPSARSPAKISTVPCGVPHPQSRQPSCATYGRQRQDAQTQPSVPPTLPILRCYFLLPLLILLRKISRPQSRRHTTLSPAVAGVHSVAHNDPPPTFNHLEPVATLPDQIQLLVHSISGRTITIDTTSSASSLQVKQAIQEKDGTPVALQRLRFNGKYLDNNTIISTAGISNLDCVHVSLSLRGGSTSRHSPTPSTTKACPKPPRPESQRRAAKWRERVNSETPIRNALYEYELGFATVDRPLFPTVSELKESASKHLNSKEVKKKGLITDHFGLAKGIAAARLEQKHVTEALESKSGRADCALGVELQVQWDLARKEDSNLRPDRLLLPAKTREPSSIHWLRPSRARRWSWMQVGAGQVSTRIVCAYLPVAPSRRVTPNSSLPNRLQSTQSILRSVGDHGCPRTIFVDHLGQQIALWKAAGEQVIVFTDANSDVYSGIPDAGSTSLTSECTPLTGVFVTSEIRGVNAFQSGHGGGIGGPPCVIVDVDMGTLIGEGFPKGSSTSRQEAPSHTSPFSLATTPSQTKTSKKQIDKLDLIKTELMTGAEANCRKIYSGRLRTPRQSPDGVPTLKTQADLPDTVLYIPQPDGRPCRSTDVTTLRQRKPLEFTTILSTTANSTEGAQTVTSTQNTEPCPPSIKASISDSGQLRNSTKTLPCYFATGAPNSTLSHALQSAYEAFQMELGLDGNIFSRPTQNTRTLSLIPGSHYCGNTQHFTMW
ncbi:hypothetical protein ACHAWO_003199 [Cyclotella atomus]|uniref:Ubiquitin-like domain-containing protein n=1 Tax=Cyclotella atomus TaxID=382360 RepID=A0ABD3QEY4_9STRA